MELVTCVVGILAIPAVAGSDLSDRNFGEAVEEVTCLNCTGRVALEISRRVRKYNVAHICNVMVFKMRNQFLNHLIQMLEFVKLFGICNNVRDRLCQILLETSQSIS
jgi:hypothetical protein